MARGKADQNAEILEYALRHLERERDDLQAKIDHIRQQLGSEVSAPAAPAAAPVVPARKAAVVVSPVAAPVAGRKPRVLSEGARKRIAAAQKRRWAEHRKAKGKAA